MHHWKHPLHIEEKSESCMDRLPNYEKARGPIDYLATGQTYATAINTICPLMFVKFCFIFEIFCHILGSSRYRRLSSVHPHFGFALQNYSLFRTYRLDIYTY